MIGNPSSVVGVVPTGMVLLSFRDLPARKGWIATEPLGTYRFVLRSTTLIVDQTNAAPIPLKNILWNANYARVRCGVLVETYRALALNFLPTSFLEKEKT